MKNVRLGDHDIAEVSAGQAAPQNPQSFGASGYPYIRAGSLEHLCSGGATSELEHIEPFVAKAHRLKLFPKDTVVFAKSGMSAKLGRVHRLQESAYVVSHLAAITPKAQLAAAYLSYFLEANPPSRLIPNEAYPSIRLSEIENITINLPPLAEQRRIAAILDKADAIRRKRQQSLELADSLLKSVFLDMFGDPVTNPKGWGKLPLGCIGELNRGVSKHRPRNDPKLLNGQHPLVQTGEVANSNLYITEYTQTYSDLGLKQSKMWPKNTLCITIAANIAKTAMLGFDACFPDSVVGFLPNEKTNIFFVHYWFSFFQKILEAEAPESAQKNINLKILKELQVIYPPFALQQKFSDIVQNVESQRVRLRVSLNESSQIFKSLQQSFFG